MVGHNFVMDWRMVWKEILIGFTIAGFVAVLMPEAWWARIFLADRVSELPARLIPLENAALAPFVTAATFIGAMAREMEGDGPIKTIAAYEAMAVMVGGLLSWVIAETQT